MLPKPLQEYIPQRLSEDSLSSGQAFLSFWDSLLEEVEKEIKEMRYFFQPERTPFPEELGKLVSAYIRPGDKDRTKRRKIASAIQRHKVQGSWDFDLKNIIDAITGYESDLYQPGLGSQWFLLSGKEGLNNYEATMGASGDRSLGLDLYGSGKEIGLKGNIPINLHINYTTPQLTASDIDALESEIVETFIPAYLKIILGYVGTSGFNEYRRI